MEKQPSIKQLYKFKTLNLHSKILEEFINSHPINLESTIVDPGLLVGIEVEVEQVPKPFIPTLFWKQDEDNSLRNHGKEYISWPLRGEQIEYSLKYLFKNISNTKQFTGRCSIHIHMNVRTMTLDQVYRMILLYCLFEKSLFDFVGQNRENNIHCVPLMQSNFFPNIKCILQQKINRNWWDKYCAINILPITEQGTVEFRHMHGTDNVRKIVTWINLLMCIKKYAIKTVDLEQEIQQLNTTRDYYGLASKVFGEYTYALKFNNKDILKSVSEIIFTLNKADKTIFNAVNDKLIPFYKIKKDIDWDIEPMATSKPSFIIDGRVLHQNEVVINETWQSQAARFNISTATLLELSVDKIKNSLTWWSKYNRENTAMNYQEWLTQHGNVNHLNNASEEPF